ncbi:MAG: hypothetical protein IJK74_06590 [Bacteroidales bacterium]|nr:hypothetical protein [Bacteroidales bacterium]
MEINGLWESEKAPKKVYVVTEYCCDDYTPIIHTIVCASYLEAHFEFKEELAQFRKSHLKFAKMMKAINPVSTEEYIAYLWNEGKNVSVFYYNTKDRIKTAA